MTSHDFCRDHLGEFLDQTLDATSREKVTAHLETCAECAQIAREMTNIRATLRGFQPSAAPPALRNNVRAALQKEAAARSQHPAARRPAFSWAMPQLAWSGTLAFAALALIVLARPFATVPPTFPEGFSAESQKEPAPRDSGSNRPQTRPATPKSAPLKKGNAAVVRENTQKSAPRVAMRDKPAELETNENSTRSRNDAPEPQRATPPETVPQNFAPAPRLTPKLQKNGFAPRPAAPSSTNTADEAPKAKTSANAGIAAMNSSVSRPKNAVMRAAVPAPLSQTESVRAADATEAPQFVADVKFAAQNSAVADAATPNLAIQSAPAISTFGAPTASKQAADAPGDVPAGGNAPNLKFAPNSDTFKNAPNSRAMRTAPVTLPSISEKSAISEGTASLTANGVTRFELQLQTPRAIERAQIRLQVALPLRLVWPTSPVVWSGDFTAKNPISVPFSIAQSKGGEKISIVVEQKNGVGASKVLDTQTMTLPTRENR